MAAMNMNQEQFEQAIREKKPVLVDFWAPWCSYCRRIDPAYEKIGEEYADSLAVGKINIDEEPRLAGADPPAVAAPGRPEIHQNGLFLPDRLLKLLLIHVHSCHICQLLSFVWVFSRLRSRPTPHRDLNLR